MGTRIRQACEGRNVCPSSFLDSPWLTLILDSDVPESAAELIGQRRRWLNGSFAAGVYSLAHFPRLYKSDHGVVRLFFLHIQAIFNTVTLIMSWFAIGNFYLTFDSESPRFVDSNFD